MYTQLYTCYNILCRILSRAVLFISHGVTEHCGRFHKLATILQENDYAVYGHDHGMLFKYVIGFWKISLNVTFYIWNIYD